MKKILFTSVMFLSLIVLPSFSFAYTTGGGIVPKCNLGNVSSRVEEGRTIWEFSNPCDFNALMELINSSINFMLFVIATPLFAVVLMYAGFKYLFDGGKGSGVKAAKVMLNNALTGYGIALVAWLIVKTILLGLGFDANFIFLTL